MRSNVSKAKLSYFSSLLENDKNDLKKYWKIVNDIRKCSKVEECNITVIMVEGKEVNFNTQPSCVVNEFNRYFCNITGTESETTRANEYTLQNRNNEVSLRQQILDSIKITSKDIIKQIKKFKTSNSTGYDGLSNNTRKELKNLTYLH